MVTRVIHHTTHNSLPLPRDCADWTSQTSSSVCFGFGGCSEGLSPNGVEAIVVVDVDDADEGSTTVKYKNDVSITSFNEGHATNTPSLANSLLSPINRFSAALPPLPTDNTSLPFDEGYNKAANQRVKEKQKEMALHTRTGREMEKKTDCPIANRIFTIHSIEDIVLASTRHDRPRALSLIHSASCSEAMEVRRMDKATNETISRPLNRSSQVCPPIALALLNTPHTHRINLRKEPALLFANRRLLEAMFALSDHHLVLVSSISTTQSLSLNQMRTSEGLPESRTSNFHITSLFVWCADRECSIPDESCDLRHSTLVVCTSPFPTSPTRILLSRRLPFRQLLLRHSDRLSSMAIDSLSPCSSALLPPSLDATSFPFTFFCLSAPSSVALAVLGQTFIQTNLIPPLFNILHPLSLPSAEAVILHICLISRISTSVWRATLDGLTFLGNDDLESKLGHDGCGLNRSWFVAQSIQWNTLLEMSIADLE
ncbi:hypothetical protein BLNAU_4796 [Blattamonas nauphoetae]|uniref:Uncharacterized protein n=1 Tax=Blattamonas nauphoetae TaxID=2049346 RepID=A0ABQ9Y917_9EUKA|nr:hypothetical protein BLNAU_4796 [Blattamonas nauphoetae]